jgi:ribosomal protein S27E
MKYNDGVEMNENMRVVICPKCHNEDFGEPAFYCRICGQALYNECNGGDGNGAYEHKNPGNARFCEYCGAENRFFKDGLLVAWDKLTKGDDGNAIPSAFNSSSLSVNESKIAYNSFSADNDDGELPF